jgi:hypothetical protein
MPNDYVAVRVLAHGKWALRFLSQAELLKTSKYFLGVVFPSLPYIFHPA